ncbi:MAG TPA: DUF1501 domain-containing protein [Fimbriimonadaceae bacterium]|nr:DUF1501 domain-containing protein [Fimbriimonadaceae bacterium]
MSDLLSRRDLFKRGGMIAIGLAAPKWLHGITHADLFRQAKGGKATGDTVLVVCQLSGGNDGLNTVVPWANKKYYELRPTLAVKEDEVLKISNEMGFHPALKGLAELYQQKKVAVIQNVGYPRQNRSHFKSMDIWQSASPEGSLKYGWIGRHFDALAEKGNLNPVVALGLSTEKPLALQGRKASIPCFASLVDVQNMVGDPDSEKMLRQIQGMEAKEGTGTRLVQQASKSALDAMAQLQKQISNFSPKETYGNDSFGQGFKQIAQLVATSPQTRVVYFSTGGFDTHARQADSHPKLLGNFGNAIQAFQKEMEGIGKADKVIVLVFSEFGRRSFENASGGTDHGAAAPMFLVGSRVKGGLHGPLPDLENLRDGDLMFTTDFREVYAATLDEWIGGDSQMVLGQKFRHAEVLNR